MVQPGATDGVVDVEASNNPEFASKVQWKRICDDVFWVIGAVLADVIREYVLLVKSNTTLEAISRCQPLEEPGQGMTLPNEG
jgi:hypothetical protein